MIVKLLTEHHLEFPSLKGGCTSSSESTLVKMSNCWKSHAEAHVVGVLKLKSSLDDMSDLKLRYLPYLPRMFRYIGIGQVKQTFF